MIFSNNLNVLCITYDVSLTAQAKYIIKKGHFPAKEVTPMEKCPWRISSVEKTLKSLLKILTLLRMCWDGISVFFDD